MIESFLLGCLIINMAIMAIQDWQTLCFPAFLLYIHLICSVIIMVVGGLSLSRLLVFLMVHLILEGIKTRVERRRGKPFLARADILLLSSAAFVFHWSNLPLFFLSSGIIGMMVGRVRKRRYNDEHIPFIPVIFLAYIITLCFS